MVFPGWPRPAGWAQDREEEGHLAPWTTWVTPSASVCQLKPSCCRRKKRLAAESGVGYKGETGSWALVFISPWKYWLGGGQREWGSWQWAFLTPSSKKGDQTSYLAVFLTLEFFSLARSQGAVQLGSWFYPFIYFINILFCTDHLLGTLCGLRIQRWVGWFGLYVCLGVLRNYWRCGFLYTKVAK